MVAKKTSSGPARALVKARINKGFTQAQAAVAIGVPRDTYAKWEIRTGVSRQYLSRAATMLGVTISDLLATSDTGVLSSRHRDLLELFNALPPGDQDRFIKLGAALAQPDEVKKKA